MMHLTPAQQTAFNGLRHALSINPIALLWGESGLPQELAEVDVSQLVEATAGFTGADLGPVVDDGKNLLAYDRARKREPKFPTSYFLAAIQAIRKNRQHYSLATNPPPAKKSAHDAPDECAWLNFC